MGSKRKRDKKRGKVSGRKRAENRKSGREQTTFQTDPDTVFFWLSKVGTERLDILPYKVGKGNPEAEEGDLHFERTFWRHAAIGVNRKPYICPAMTAGKKCPVCEYRNKLMQEEEDPSAESKKLIKNLKPKERQVFNVIDTENRDKGVQIWDIAPYNFGERLDADVNNSDEEDGIEYFADLEDGRTLRLAVEDHTLGDGGRPFKRVDSISFKRRSKPYEESILEQTHCLDDILVIPTYDELSAIFHQTSADDSDDEKGEDGGKPSKKKKGKKAKSEADEAGLKEGMKVEYQDDECTIVKISGDGTSLTLEDEDGDPIRAVAPADVTIVESDKREEKSEKKKKGKKEKEPKPDDDDDDDGGGDDDDDWNFDDDDDD